MILVITYTIHYKSQVIYTLYTVQKLVIYTLYTVQKLVIIHYILYKSWVITYTIYWKKVRIYTLYTVKKSSNLYIIQIE